MLTWLVILRHAALLPLWFWCHWPPSSGLRAMAWRTIAQGGISTPIQAATEHPTIKEKEDLYG